MMQLLNKRSKLIVKRKDKRVLLCEILLQRTLSTIILYFFLIVNIQSIILKKLYLYLKNYFPDQIVSFMIVLGARERLDHKSGFTLI